MIQLFHMTQTTTLNPTLQSYIETNIFPRYQKYYSHGMIHINHVIQTALELAAYYHLNPNMAYVIAAYHDLGLNIDRDHHEYASGQILAHDPTLPQFFTPAEIKIMQTAVEDHRGSRKDPPRNLYGRILSDADRDFDIKILAKRQLATSLKNYPKITTFPEHFERCYQYILGRLNTTGKFNLWTDHPLLIQARDQFTQDYLNKKYARSIYQEEWDRISRNGTLDKILNYYEDY